MIAPSRPWPSISRCWQSFEPGGLGHIDLKDSGHHDPVVSLVEEARLAERDVQALRQTGLVPQPGIGVLGNDGIVQGPANPLKKLIAAMLV